MAHTAKPPVLTAAIVLVAAAVAAYANSFAGPFIFDDFLSIPQNPTLDHFPTALVPPGGGVTVMGRPLLNLSFAFNRAISGDQVWSYHALNLLIHVLAGLTLFGLVQRTLVGLLVTTTRPGCALPDLPPGEVTVAFIVALWWLVHPLQTEAVTYLVQRAESLMSLCYLLTLYCFLRGAESGRAAGWFFVSFLSCLAGMATKEVMVSAPVIVLLYDCIFLSGSFRGAWRRHGQVHLALAATWILLALLVLRAGNRGGSAGFGSGAEFWTYLATQFQAIVHYLTLVVWPHPLILDYGVQWTNSVWEVVPYAAVVAALVAITVAGCFRRPALGFLGVIFCALLAPTSLVPGGRQTLAEHRMYLALAPVLVLLALVLRGSLHRWWRLVAVAVALALGLLTLLRNYDYRSSIAIWRDTVEKRPGNAAARNNYGNLLAQAHQPSAALEQYAAAVQINPAYADAYYNAGNASRELDRPHEAIAYYEQALRLRPGDVAVLVELGQVLAREKRWSEAIACYEQALQLRPGLAAAHRHLGRALAATMRLSEAMVHLHQALAACRT